MVSRRSSQFLFDDDALSSHRVRTFSPLTGRYEGGADGECTYKRTVESSLSGFITTPRHPHRDLKTVFKTVSGWTQRTGYHVKPQTFHSASVDREAPRASGRCVKTRQRARRADISRRRWLKILLLMIRACCVVHIDHVMHAAYHMHGHASLILYCTAYNHHLQRPFCRPLVSRDWWNAFPHQCTYCR